MSHPKRPVHADPTEPTRRRLRVPLPRAMAGGSLAIAAVGAAATLALSGGVAAPAYAVTDANGTVQVSLNYASGLEGANAQLKSMGTGEQISIREGSGPATTPGAVTCTKQDGASGPNIEVLQGNDGTEVIAPGQSAGNTAEGTFHLVSCDAYPADYTGNSGSGASTDVRGTGSTHPDRVMSRTHAKQPRWHRATIKR